MEEAKKLLYSDKRITHIIIEHWYEIKKNNILPSEKDLDSTLLENILDSCFLMKISPLKEGCYDYKFLGKNIMEAYGSDITQHIDNVAANPLSYKDKIEQVLQTKRPVIDEGEFTNINGDLIKYRQCLVPLGLDKINVDSIFGGMRYKIFHKNNTNLSK